MASKFPNSHGLNCHHLLLWFLGHCSIFFVPNVPLNANLSWIYMMPLYSSVIRCTYENVMSTMYTRIIVVCLCTHRVRTINGKNWTGSRESEREKKFWMETVNSEHLVVLIYASFSVSYLNKTITAREFSNDAPTLNEIFVEKTNDIDKQWSAGGAKESASQTDCVALFAICYLQYRLKLNWSKTRNKNNNVKVYILLRSITCSNIRCVTISRMFDRW